MGRCAKILVSYDRPFWRDHGLAGIALGNGDWIELCADSSDPQTGVGVIGTFVVGDRYRRWRSMSDDDRRAAVLADLAIYLGEEALTASSYDEVDWPGDPWAGGGYAAFMPPGVWTSTGDTPTSPARDRSGAPKSPEWILGALRLDRLFPHQEGASATGSVL